MKKNLLTKPPIGIIVTHPIAFFKRYSEEVYLRSMQMLNTTEDHTWTRVMKNLPTREFLYIYTVYDGKVQHRTNLVETFRNRSIRMPRAEGGMQVFDNASGIVLGPPFVRAPYEIHHKGFQGFKYTDKELW